jgi:hypothetical protein
VRRHGLKVAKVEEWRERFLISPGGLELTHPVPLFSADLGGNIQGGRTMRGERNRLKREVGELTIDLEILPERLPSKALRHRDIRRAMGTLPRASTRCSRGRKI